MNPHHDILIKWAKEVERRVDELKIIAKTDPARYRPAMEAVKVLTERANGYRLAALRGMNDDPA